MNLAEMEARFKEEQEENEEFVNDGDFDEEDMTAAVQLLDDCGRVLTRLGDSVPGQILRASDLKELLALADEIVAFLDAYDMKTAMLKEVSEGVAEVLDGEVIK